MRLEQFVCRDFKGISHPLRVAILRCVVDSDKPISPVVTAKALGQPLTNVSYHFRMLVDMNLLKGVGYKPRRGALEHFYEADERVPYLLKMWEDYMDMNATRQEDLS